MKSNFLDRTIEWFAPRYAASRMRARMAMDAVRGFDGAKRGPRSAGWRTSGASSLADLMPSLATLRNRARNLVINNSHLRRALKILVANAIGTGIQAKFADEKQRKSWKRWVKYCDADGLLDFYGLQAKAYRSMKLSGEVLVRFRRRRASDGLEVPLQIQILEIDYLDSLKVGEVAGGFILAGVQFNLIGQRVGYWLFDQHPGEIAQVPKNMQSRFVPASEVLHLFDAIDRPNSVRGFPWLASAIWAARDLDEYQDAERIRKKIEACFAVFVKSQDDQFRAGTPGVQSPGDPRRVESLSPGMIEYLRTDEDVSFAAPATNDGYEAGVRIDLRAIAAGTDTTYEQLTGDYSQVNFTSGRMGKMEFNRMLTQELWLIFIPMFCEAIAAQFAATAYLAGVTASPDYDVSWSPNRIEMIDPLREANGMIALIEARLKSRHQSIRDLGDDPEETDAEITTDPLNTEIPEPKGTSPSGRVLSELLSRLRRLELFVASAEH
ncbi:phage portal protein [Burkholderia sp. Bp9142]|uniref:phage portal protein n=1 Tax=Burkholderia sp. Bp9142 TaxID=2184573 RepID=UPI000F5961D8|nr:phage portal protein [Burkholderia sp. Bp9142]RQR37846.1 phage portal protein [Burkholderia sp. Bp9142]